MFLQSAKRATPALAILIIVASLFPSSVPRVSSQVGNLISNPSAETLDAGGQPVDWFNGTWGTNNATLSSTTAGHTGRGLQVVMTSRTSGDAKWYPKPVSVTPGTKVQVSSWYTSTVPSFFKLRVTSTTGAFTYVHVANLPAAGNWTSVATEYTVPANAKEITIFHFIETPGTLVMDDYSLTEVGSPIPSPTPTPVPTPTATPIPTPTPVFSLISNHSMENTGAGGTTVDWFTNQWGTNSTAFSRSATGHTGASLTATISSWTSGDAKWYPKPIPVTPGAAYSFSSWYKSTTPSYLKFRVTSTTGAFTYVHIANLPAAGNWTPVSATWTAPVNAKEFTVLHFIASVGTLSIDDVVFKNLSASPSPTPTATPIPTPTPTPVPTPSPSPTWTAAPNLISNPSFETKKTGVNEPANWTPTKGGTHNAAFTYQTTGRTGTRSAKVTISGYTNGDAYWLPPSKPVTGGKIYEVSAYYQSNVYTNVLAHYTLSDGGDLYQSLYIPPASPNGWNLFYTQFQTPANAVSLTIYQSLEQVGYVTTDDWTLREYKPNGFARGLVSITIDADIVKYGLPVMNKYAFKGTHVMTPGFIDENDTRPDFINPTTLRRLRDEGHEIAAHTMTHPFLPSLSLTEARYEIEESKRVLEEWLGTTIHHFAAPFGEVTPAVLDIIRESFTSHRGTDPGYNSKDNFGDGYNIKVHYMHENTTAAQVRAWADRAKLEGTWMALVYHNVHPDVNVDVDTTTPTLFDAQMKALQDAGIPVRTVEQALNEIRPQL